MTTISRTSDLRVDIARWSGCQVPRAELIGALTFLAHKAGKSVRCAPFRGGLQYAAGFVNVYICTSESCTEPSPVWRVKLAGRFHDVHGKQARFESVKDLPGREIRDEEGRLLARVDHNCVLIPIDITAVDNDAARAILAHVVEEAVPLLDFDIDELVDKQKQQITEQYGAFHRSALRSRISDRTREVQRLEREASDLYYRLVGVERDLPIMKQELEVLQDLAEGTVPPLVAKQAKGILDLIANGQYEEITPAADGSLVARTSQILIEYDAWLFELGRYEIGIDAAGKVTILSADGIEADGYPHPHVDSNGRPCLGNISADLAKSVGKMRIAEALTLLYDFLSSYNHDGPFVRIGKFDPNYDDPDEAPCDDCPDYGTPHCILECPHNDGQYCCSDCCEYRTEFCYTECPHNVPGFEYVSPCDNCERDPQYCFLECQFNENWEQGNPCDDCNRPTCDGCPFLEKKLRLQGRDAPAPASGR